MLRLFFLASIGLFFCQNAISQTQKSQPVRSLLWEISSSSAAQPSFLYGTMHVPEKLAFHLSDSFFVALKSADIVALETDPETWQPFFQEISAVEMGQKTGAVREIGPYDGFAPDFYNFTFQFQPPSNQMLSGMLSAQPAMANQLLFRTGGMGQDFEEDTYLDMFIYQAGRKLRKPVVGLENTAESYEMATRSNIPDDDAEADFGGGMGFFGGFSEIQEAYRAQDIDLIDSLSRKAAPGKNRQKWMIDERNAVMCRRLDSLIRLQKTVFAGVGAAHLAGPEGMIPMLRKMGYAVRPVLFLAHAESKVKLEIDQMRLPVELKTHFSKDSAWSALAPAPFFPAGRGLETGDDFEVLSADLANGAFYAVFRMKTFSALAGKGRQTMADRLDSLVYENIPGKISERKRAKTDGLENFDITTRTRRGDAQRYRIFVSDDEIFMFVAGGNGDWAMGKEASSFLESAKLTERSFNKKTTKWQHFEPKKGGFALNWPVQPAATEPRMAQNGAFSMAATDAEDGSFYLVAREFLADVDYIEEDSFELNYLTEKVAERMGFKILERLDPAASWPHQKTQPATDFLMAKKDDSTAFAHGRLVIDGADFWLLIAKNGSQNGSKTRPEGFFSSFETRAWQYSAPFETVEDSVGNFKISLPKTEKKESAIAQKLAAIQKEIIEKSSKMYGGFDPEAMGYDAEIGQKIFVAESAETGERVWLTREKMGPSEAFPDQDSLQRWLEGRLNPAKSLVFRQKNWRNAPSDSFLMGEFLLEDTNSVRGIWAKTIVRDREIWQIRATSRASGEPNSGFVATAFQSFSPLRSATGESLFGERDLTFLDEIFSEDSATAAQAIRKLPFLRPEKGDFARLAAMVERPEFSKLKMRDREQILASISRTEPDQARPFFENFYKKWPDTATYQVAALKGLVNLQSAASHDAFLKLLDEEPPFLSPSALGDIFYAFQDSLPLARRLFPKLLGWMNYPEFQPSVLSLLADLVEKGHLKPKVYASKKAELLRDGRRSLAQLRYAAERAAQDGQNAPMAYDFGYAGADKSSASASVLQFARLLAPFQKKDAAVAEFFEKLRRVNDNDFRLQLFSLFFDQKWPVSEAELKPIFDDRKRRARLFGLLKTKKQLTPSLEKWFADEVDLARSFLESNAATFGYQAEKWDTIRLLERHRVAAKTEKGELFFFEMKPEKGKTKRLAYVFVPENCDWSFAGPVFSGPYDYRKAPQSRILQEYEEQGKTHAELIRSKLASYRLSGRQRVRADWSSGLQW